MTRPTGIRAFYPRWTPEEDAELRRLVARNLSCRKISLEMGGAHSHSAVVARCRRLGLQLNGHQTSAGRAAAARRAGKPRGAAKPQRKPEDRNPWGWGAVKKVAARNTPPPLPRTPPSTPTMWILGLERHHCKFIGERPELINVETPIYCGERVQDGSSYCPHHHAICWRPVRRTPGAAFRLWRQPV